MHRLSRGFVLILSCALALSVSAPSIPGTPAQEALTAEQILHQVGITYSGSRSYSDRGLVRSLFILESGNQIDQRPFLTAFIRPDRFRFEFSHRFEFRHEKGSEHRYIIWRSGKEVRTWWDIQPGTNNMKMDSLSEAISAAAGVSRGLVTHHFKPSPSR